MRAAEDEPVRLTWPIGHVEAHDDDVVRQLSDVHELAGHPQHVGRIQVVWLDLQPPRTPLTHRVADALQVPAHLGQPVRPSPAGCAGRALQDAVTFQRVEPLREERG
jgi:hypothetical protein